MICISFVLVFVKTLDQLILYFELTVYVGVVNESTVSNTLQFELGSLLPNSAYGPSIVLP